MRLQGTNPVRVFEGSCSSDPAVIEGGERPAGLGKLGERERVDGLARRLRRVGRGARLREHRPRWELPEEGLQLAGPEDGRGELGRGQQDRRRGLLGHQVAELDGGAVVMTLAEAATGKPLPDKVQNVGLTIGLVCLAAFALVVTFQDVLRLPGGC